MIKNMIKKENFCKVETYCPCFTGFYETDLGGIDYEKYDLFENFDTVKLEYIQEIFNIIYFEMNYRLLNEDISKQVVNYINKVLKEEDLQMKLKYQNLISPKQYNYSTDSINVKALFTIDTINKLTNYITNNVEEFKKYIEERYTSYSGFISFYSNDYREWLKYLNKDDLQDNSHLLGTFLEFYLYNNINNIEEDIYEYCRNYFKGNGALYDDKYLNFDIVIKKFNEKFNLNIKSLEDLEDTI